MKCTYRVQKGTTTILCKHQVLRLQLMVPINWSIIPNRESLLLPSHQQVQSLENQVPEKGGRAENLRRRAEEEEEERVPERRSSSPASKESLGSEESSSSAQARSGLAAATTAAGL
jgi:hypothetical protein